MKNRTAIAVAYLMLGLLGSSEMSFSHGTENYAEMATADIQMQKLHAMMPIFFVASNRLETALEKGDITTVLVEAGRITAALPDLKKSKPHKNIDQLDKFVELATDLEKSIISVVDLAKKGDFTGAKAVFEKAKNTCDTCHAIFRD